MTTAREKLDGHAPDHNGVEPVGVAPPRHPVMSVLPRAVVTSRLAEIARDLEAERPTDLALQRLVVLAQDLVGPSASSGITLTRADGSRAGSAFTSGPAQRAQELEDELGEGPGRPQHDGLGTLEVDDLARDLRWPHWSRRVSDELGMGSCLVLRLFDDDRHGQGVLSLFAADPIAFSESDRQQAEAVAAHLSTAAVAVLHIDQLKSGLARRTTIGQATGILMERFGLDAEGAMALLRRLSSTSNRKVHLLAAELTSTGDLPGLHARALRSVNGADGVARSSRSNGAAIAD